MVIEINGNVRFLAGYRRGWLFDPDFVAAVDDAVADGMSTFEAERATVWATSSGVESRPWDGPGLFRRRGGA